ncbi:MAG: N-acetylneuraminate synthase family protein [Ilumatobacteraceae bacterium]
MTATADASAMTDSPAAPTTSPSVSIAGRPIGEGQPIYVIAEIGINHNGDLDIAKALIDVAAEAGCDAVKFQKRTPDVCVPDDQKAQIRSTPWGEMTYLDYRYRVEFGEEEYGEIAAHADARGVHWFASPWDVPSVDFLEKMDTVAYKVASACLTDDELLSAMRDTERPVILSTGMSTMDEIDHAVEILGTDRMIMLHTTSTYPCPAEESNLRTMLTLRDRFGVPVGYSGHERGLQVSIGAAAMGASTIERHITLDRTMWGSDQAASIEPQGLGHLVRDLRIIETALGDGVKRVYPGELAPRERLRRVG